MDNKISKYDPDIFKANYIIETKEDEDFWKGF